MNELCLIPVIPNETEHLLDFSANSFTFQLIQFDQPDQWEIFGMELQRAEKKSKETAEQSFALAIRSAGHMHRYVLNTHILWFI